MVDLKAIQNIAPMDVSVSKTIDKKTYLKKCRGGFSPLSPLPGSSYGCVPALPRNCVDHPQTATFSKQQPH